MHASQINGCKTFKIFIKQFPEKSHHTFTTDSTTLLPYYQPPFRSRHRRQPTGSSHHRAGRKQKNDGVISHFVSLSAPIVDVLCFKVALIVHNEGGRVVLSSLIMHVITHGVTNQ